MFQFTRPQGARLQGFLVLYCYQKVSIHAPTRGATLRQRKRQRQRQVSIHAPTRGATNNPYISISIIFGFNSRAHKGRDISNLFFLTVKSLVSIHAPTRGATKISFKSKSFLSFQFTRPQGARLHVSAFQYRPIASFNSRAHKGRDQAL